MKAIIATIFLAASLISTATACDQVQEQDPAVREYISTNLLYG